MRAATRREDRPAFQIAPLRNGICDLGMGLGNYEQSEARSDRQN